MYAQQLIGKLAIRTKATSKGSVFDNSYTATPLLIINATDSHIVYEYPEDSTVFKVFGCRIGILNYCFCDDAWIDYNELINKPKPKIVQEAYDILNELGEDKGGKHV